MNRQARILQIGSVLEIAFPFYRHRGIVTGADSLGRPLVTANSAKRGGVCEEPLADFLEGSTYRLIEVPSFEQVPMILVRAKQKLGTRYSLVDWNCDHFVEWAMGREVKSDQLRGWVAVASLVLVAGLAAGRA